eukprot:1148598-Pelagomonas_calceolata.AAC.4
MENQEIELKHASLAFVHRGPCRKIVSAIISKSSKRFHDQPVAPSISSSDLFVALHGCIVVLFTPGPSCSNLSFDFTSSFMVQNWLTKLVSDPGWCSGWGDTGRGCTDMGRTPSPKNTWSSS